MTSGRRKEKRECEIERLTMNIIYTLCYGLSQKCNFVQKDFSAFLLSENLNRPALNTARRFGVTCAHETGRLLETSSITAYEQKVDEIINRAIDEGHFIIVIIDDFTTVHSYRQPEYEQTSNAKSMCTIVLRVFENIKAIPLNDSISHLDPNVLSPQILSLELTDNANLNILTTSFAAAMPHQIKSQFFNPETVRCRLGTHEYKESDDARLMRRLDNMYLLDFQECKLKNIDGNRTALSILFKTKVRNYCLKYPLMVLGDWPTQFYLRQIVYNRLRKAPSRSSLTPNVFCQPEASYFLQMYNPELSIIPMLGALHISLNAQENVMKMFHSVFKFLYQTLFPNSKLADKPKPCRTTLILEAVYGGWTVVRDPITQLLSKCRDIECTALINLFDNYIPLVLSIYSIIFKCNLFKEYFKSVIRVWIMFFCFRRRHYDKAPLVWLSNILYWKKMKPGIFNIIKENITIFDEYPVENAHSIFRAQTKAYFTVDQLIHRVKSVFASKSKQHEFRSAFTPPRYYSLNVNQLQSLKLRAASILKTFFVNKITNLISGNYSINKDLWGCEKIPLECLPIGYQSKFPPQGNKLCDLPGCNSGEVICWKRFDGCAHAFHKRCLTNEDVCSICQTFLKKELERLAKIAKDAVLAQEVRGDINDNISNETNKEVDDVPCVEEITEAEVMNKIGELTKELYSLSPPSYLISEGLSSSDCISSNDNRRHHCRICQHEIKGHKKISDNKKHCPICPGSTCSASGHCIPCTCDFHSSQQEVSTHEESLILSSYFFVRDHISKCIFPSQISQEQMARSFWCNACTVISLYTGISFLDKTLHLSSGDITEELAMQYKACIQLGVSVYENILNPPDNQPNLSVTDVLSQIRLPLRDPGNFKGIMIDDTSETSFEVVVANACSEPGRKCLLFILQPDHSIVFCMNHDTIAAFDSHQYGNNFGAMIMCGRLDYFDSFMAQFHHSMREGYGKTVRGANYNQLELKL